MKSYRLLMMAGMVALAAPSASADDIREVVVPVSVQRMPSTITRGEVWCSCSNDATGQVGLGSGSKAFALTNGAYTGDVVVRIQTHGSSTPNYWQCMLKLEHPVQGVLVPVDVLTVPGSTDGRAHPDAARDTSAPFTPNVKGIF